MMRSGLPQHTVDLLSSIKMVHCVAFECTGLLTCLQEAGSGGPLDVVWRQDYCLVSPKVTALAQTLLLYKARSHKQYLPVRRANMPHRCLNSVVEPALKVFTGCRFASVAAPEAGVHHVWATSA